MATPNYTINYEDERFKQVESDKQAAITEINDTYGSMINQSDKFYKDQIEAAEDYGRTQSQIQQQNTDFAIKEINQQKEQAGKDYAKEQSASYVDWQKQSNQYGVNAEQQAASGLVGTGFSESSQVSMYNTYQNRVATAREVYAKAVLNYDNAIQEARLQNNAALAEIAYNTLKTTLDLSLEGFQYKNQLITDRLDKQQQADEMYYSRWQDVLQQQNTENAMAEEVRQFNENKELEIQKLNEQIRQFDLELERLKAKDTQEAKMQAEQLKLQKQELKLKEQQLAEEKRQFNESLKATKSSSGGGGGSYTVSSGGGGGNEVETDFYSGALNKDAKTYGTFGNGYQPKGISGHGKLSAYKKGGKTQYITVTSKTLKGKTVKTTQKIWKAEDGTLWYWFGQENKYIRYKK